MNKGIHKRWNLTVSLVLFVFAVMIAAMLLVVLLVLVLHLLGILHLWEGDADSYATMYEGFGDHEEYGSRGIFGPLAPLAGLMAFSIFMGTAIAAFFSRKALAPIRTVISATQVVAEGDFDVRVDLKGIYELEELSQSFNKMVQELASIETFRADFINSFSHEFKTPIVSIRGFAKLLQDGELSEDEKKEYLDIIIVESERLAELSTNILNLQRYESMEIVTDKTLFQLDEQIRRAIVMTEPQWASKDLDLKVEMDRVMFEGNEDLVQQIWLNLLDNAIKFSCENGVVCIRLSGTEDGALFSIQDHGIGMDEQTIERAFDKFYQGDSSHAKAGNGLGLTIAKHITELCGGTLTVQSKPEKGSTFSVFLPTHGDSSRDS